LRFIKAQRKERAKEKAKIARIAVLFPLIAGMPAFGQAVLPTQGVVDDVKPVLDGPGGSSLPDVFYITLKSTQVAVFRVTTEFRDGRKITQTVVFRTATLGRWRMSSDCLKLLKTVSIHQTR
jgi:hypothetical protein